jgi:hypothetical protein
MCVLRNMSWTVKECLSEGEENKHLLNGQQLPGHLTRTQFCVILLMDFSRRLYYLAEPPPVAWIGPGGFIVIVLAALIVPSGLGATERATGHFVESRRKEGLFEWSA